MFDDYSATLPLLIVVILENVAVAWVYGTDKYVTCLHKMFLSCFYIQVYYVQDSHQCPLVAEVYMASFCSKLLKSNNNTDFPISESPILQKFHNRIES